MSIPVHKMNFPREFPCAVFIVLTRLIAQNEQNELENLFTYKLSEKSNFWESFASLESTDRMAFENLIASHVYCVLRFHELQALPFLPDEAKIEFKIVSAELKRSWGSLSDVIAEFIFSPGHELTEKLKEEIDFTLLIFLEWAHDVDFLACTEQQRRIYINEFPFSNDAGAHP